MSLTGFVLPVIGLGVLLFFLGIALLLKRVKTAGIIVAFSGMAIAAIPALVYAYVVIAMQ